MFKLLLLGECILMLLSINFSVNSLINHFVDLVRNNLVLMSFGIL